VSYNFLSVLLDADNDPIINGSKKNLKKAVSGDMSMQQSRSGSFSTTIIGYIALFLAAYYFLIRPHKKQQEKILDFQSKLKPGDNIIISSGLHGKIISINDQTAIVEFGINKGIRIPVNKSHIMLMDDNSNSEIENNDQDQKNN